MGLFASADFENAEGVTQHSPGPEVASITSSRAALGNRQSPSLYTTMSVGVPLSRFALGRSIRVCRSSDVHDRNEIVSEREAHRQTTRVAGRIGTITQGGGSFVKLISPYPGLLC
jgi:hypothetical protein